MNVEKNVPPPASSTLSQKVSEREEHPSYASGSYQKILDYHVSEILLTTVIIGTILLLLRLHR